MANYIIATIKSWNIDNCKKLEERFPNHNFRIVTKKEELTNTRYQAEIYFFSALVMDDTRRCL